MAKSSPLLSRAKERRKKKLLRWLVAGAVLLIAIVAGLVFLSRAPQLQIVSFDISGTNPADDAAIRALVTDAASGYYLYFFPKSDAFLYPAAAVQAEILSRFPEIRSADVKRKDSQTIQAALAQKKPVAIWCGSAPDLASPTRSCLFLDESGEAYKQAPQFSVSPYFEYFGTLSSGSLPAAFLPQERFAALESLVSSMSDIFPAVSAYATPEGDFELRNASGTVIKIAEKAGYADEYRYLKAFLSGESLGSAAGDPDRFETP